APPGLHPIELRLIDERDGSRIVSRGIAHVSIVSSPRLELVAVGTPQFVTAGSQYRATFLLKNTGNAGAAVRVRARTYPDFAARLDTVSFLRAGEERTIRASVSTRRTDMSSVTHRLYLEAVLPGVDSAVSKAQSEVLVVARADDNDAGDYAIPARLRVIAGGRANAGESGAVAFELSGNGALSDGGNTRIDFLARRSKSAYLPFAMREEYRLGLSSPFYDLRLGQQVFALSPLAREGKSGSGASVRLKMGLLSVGGFRSDERWDPALGRSGAILRDPESAAFIELRPVRAIGIGINYLSASDVPRGELWTARLQFDPHSLMKVSVESGAGMRAASAERGSMISARGDSRYLSYAMRHEKADTGFAGSRPGSTGTYGQIAIRPFRRLQLSAGGHKLEMSSRSWRDTARVHGLSRETDAGVAITGLAALRFRVSDRDLGGFSVQGLQRTTAVQLTPRLGFLALDAQLERGTLADTTGAAHPVESISLRSTIGPAFGHSLSAFMRRDSGRWAFAASEQTRVSRGINAVVRAGRRFSLELFGIRTEDSTVSGRRSSTMLDAFAAFTAGSGFAADFRWRAITSGAANVRPEMQFSLTVPLGIPARRSGNAGRITGRVYDVATGRGVPNALVKVGDQAVLTDKSGRLDFGSVRPNTYNVQLDLGSLGGGRVPLAGAGTPITARAGKTSRIELGVGRGSRVTGRVRLYAPADPMRWSGAIEQASDTGGISGLIVTLTNGEDTHRRVTDGDGSFEASELRPGRWTASVAGEDLPPLHHLAPDSLATRVAAGETGTIEIRVLPRKRTLRIVSGGEITAGKGTMVDTQTAAITPAAVVSPPPRGSSPRPAAGAPPVISPRPAVAPPPVVRAARGVYSVQVGKYRKRAGADYLAASLRRHRVPATVYGKSAPYRVIIGRYFSLQDADKALLAIRRQGRMDGVVVRIGDR
ncbi:MAG TPA: SPOR domain-containing protein, partial [Gemmatimonadaceae bacterium]|nr:SPOR domain-containing protein [Gemmatimonadaceae bacterium]